MQRPCSFLVTGIALLGTVLTTGCAVSSVQLDSKADIDQAREAIWAKELAIYAARGKGDLETYLANTSLHYMGWPPGWDKPSGQDQLRAGAAQMKGQAGEELTMDLTGFTLSGDTGVIYYSTHRTRLPGGAATDQRFHVIHVWTREQGEWKLIGALGRDGSMAQQGAAK